MAKVFSLATWNIENFEGKTEREARVVEILDQQKTDVFVLPQIVGKYVFSELVDQLPRCQFDITEGSQTEEALVGVKRGSQRCLARKSNSSMAISILPGALLTPHLYGVNHEILFLYTKSSSNPFGLAIHDDQFERAVKFRKNVLDKKAGDPGNANFIFIGDLPTIGIHYFCV